MSCSNLGTTIHVAKHTVHNAYHLRGKKKEEAETRMQASMHALLCVWCIKMGWVTYSHALQIEWLTDSG